MAKRAFGKIVVTSRVDSFMQDLRKEAQRRAIACANEVRNESLKGMRGKKSGRVYPVPGTKKKTYTASAPGEFPAVRTAALRTSIRVIAQVHIFSSVGPIARGIVGTHLLYGLYLEEGTPRMARRPWLTMALAAALPAINRILSERWGLA